MRRFAGPGQPAEPTMPPRPTFPALAVRRPPGAEDQYPAAGVGTPPSGHPYGMRTPVLEHFARFGFAVYGAVHLVIAWLAVRIATGEPPREGDQGGAFKTIADQPAGRWLVIAAGVGLASLAIWQALQAVVGHRNEPRREQIVERLTSAARAVVYAVLTYTAFSLLAGNSTPKGDQQQAATARL